MGKGKTKTRVKGLPPKEPKTNAAGAAKLAEDKPLFCFRFADRAADERWRFTPTGTDSDTLWAFLCEMANLSWGEIVGQTTGGLNRHKKHHSQDVATLVQEAQDDFNKRELWDTFGDEMFRFRLSGVRRLWGFRVDRTFHVVWWDPEHKVYPTEKD